MRVYVLMEADYGGSNVRGAYKSEADAIEAADAFQRAHIGSGTEYVCEKRSVGSELLIQYRPGLEFWLSGWEL